MLARMCILYTVMAGRKGSSGYMSL